MERASRRLVDTCLRLYVTLMGMSTPHVTNAIAEKSLRNMRRNRRNITASRPILSTSSGSLVLISGGNQPNKLSDMRGGPLSPT